VTVTTRTGDLASGGRYRAQVPAEWNGTLLLHCTGAAPPSGQPPPLARDDAVAHWLLQHGYALAGSAYATPGFWPLEAAFDDQIAALDVFERDVSQPARTVVWGPSMGGIITAGLVQLVPERFHGALPTCGSLAGGVAVRNQNLDCAFVFKTLLAPDSGLQLVDIADAAANVARARAALDLAQSTPQGRARIALAAAIANIPGWFGVTEPQPRAADAVAREYAQYRWLRDADFGVFFGMRAELERRAGGNPSWNSAVDYGSLLRRSIGHEQVAALYDAAALDLDADLDVLAHAPRITAHRAAEHYLERHITFNGDLGGVAVLTLHSLGDGLVTPDNESAYADVVASTRQGESLRQVFVSRGGHCAYTAAETITCLRALVDRLDRGGWAGLDPVAMNEAAAELGPALNALPHWPAVTSQRSAPGPSQPAPAAFHASKPAEYLRPHDGRSRPPAGALA
jgi:hypothetical protein